MKKIVSILSFVVSTQSFAAINCKEYKDDINIAQANVDNFQLELTKLQDQLLRIEDKISDKMRILDPIKFDLQNTQSLITTLMTDKSSLRQELNILEQDLQLNQTQQLDMMNHISSLEIQIDQMSSRNPERRNLMREKNRLKKMLERIDISISQAHSAINPLKSTLKQVRQEIKQNESKLIALEEEKFMVENQVPKLSALINKKVSLNQELSNQDIIAQENLNLLDLAIEKHLMCKTYTVKYQVSLDISKEIYELGCDNYQSKNFRGQFKDQAELETFNAICVK